MKTRILIIFLFVFSISVLPQKKELTLRQVTLQRFGLSPKSLSQLQWIPGGNNFVYVDKSTDEVLLKGNIDNTATVALVKLFEINSALTGAKLDALSSFPSFDWLNANSIRFWNGKKLVRFNLENKSAEVLNTIPEDAENIEVNSNNAVAYTIKNNLFVSVNGNSFQITNDENPGIVNGQTVHRVEFGINKGIFWSPDNKFIAFYSKDETMVTDYPVVDFSQHPAKLAAIKYPMAGMTSEQVKVGVYSLDNNETVWLNTGEPKDHYLTGVTWSPDSKDIYIGILNRDQNHLWETKYDAATGQPIKILFEEKSDKYVHPEHGPIFVKNNPNQFIWFSARDGWDHLYLYNTDGKLLKQLTKGNWLVTSLDGFDDSGKNIYYSSTQISPIETQYYSLNLNSGDIQKITNQPGTHTVDFRSDGKYFLDTYSSLNNPGESVILDSKGNTVRSVYKSDNPLADYNIGKTKIFKIKGNAGFDFYCRMIFPPDFDSTKTYPVVVYVYGGPNVQLITDRWLGGGSLWFNYMAEQGYIIFTLDSRGSANRGLAFEQETFRHLGTKEVEDQKLGVEYLKSLPYVDGSRLGVFGWSYGGFMTTSLMTRTPDLFKAGVAGAPVIDWSYYEVMYTERYMDTPQSNPEGYKESSLLNYVGNLKGKFLMVQGTSDATVVWQNSLLFAKKAANLGIPLDYYPYVGHLHGVRGVDYYHLYDKITTFFNDNLK